MFPVFILTVAVGVESRPAAAPPTGKYHSDWKLIGHPSFTEAISALSSMIFAYAGTPAFFSIISEMRDPKHYTRSMILCQSTVTITYTVIGIVVYYYCGSYVASPALGSAGHSMKKICYGIALPGLLVSTLILLHVGLLVVNRHMLTNI
jgi:amino acid permease